MKASLLVNNNAVPLNDFTQAYIANILCAIAGSLGADSKNVTIRIETDGLHIFTDNQELDIKKDFAKQLVENTIKGMLSPLKGVFWLTNITIMSEGSTISAKSFKKGLTDR